MSGLRTLALPVGAALLFAGALLYSKDVQSRPSDTNPVEAVVPAGREPPAGFRPDAWFLPDDPLLGFVEIPGGSFLMGSDPSSDSLAFDNEAWAQGPSPRAVDLPSFYMARYEVTVAQFRAFVSATGHDADPVALAGPLDHPVAAVSWVDALAYCRWLDATLHGWSSAPPDLARRLGEGWQISLPTEAQWEKAARGSDGRTYPWGDTLRTDRANFAGGGPVRVGSTACPECSYGLSDMSGNVWEWTRTPFLPGPYDPANASLDLEADALWVMRGGSFQDPPRNVRAALRGGADPSVRRPFIGFRIALTPP